MNPMRAFGFGVSVTSLFFFVAGVVMLILGRGTPGIEKVVLASLLYVMLAASAIMGLTAAAMRTRTEPEGSKDE